MTIPISLLIVHFIADFLLQSDWMALNKSKDRMALLAHTLTYGICFLPWGLTFAFWTFILHYWTDRVTSKCTTKLWFIDLFEPHDCPQNREPRHGTYQWFDGALVRPARRHWFFVMIGLDQLIHFITLAITYRLIFGG